MAAPQTLQQAILYFSDYANCHKAVSEIRWPDGVVRCPHCGSENVTYLENARVWKCYARHPKAKFSLKVGTLFEDSAIGLEKWLPALWLVVNCKNGISSYELARALGVTQKTAWFMLSRLRMALHDDPSDKLSGHVEADETFIGGRGRFMHKDRKARILKGRQSGTTGKIAVAGLLERTSPDRPSRVRTMVVPNVRRFPLQSSIRANVTMDGESTIYSDALKSYERSAKYGPYYNYIHKVIDHAERYVDGVVHTNGMENYWSLLKRTLRGTYVSVQPFHLFRYLDEQAYRFNNRKGTDASRFWESLKGILGKRLTYVALTGSELPQTC
jgi:transposase-like protein